MTNTHITNTGDGGNISQSSRVGAGLTGGDMPKITLPSDMQKVLGSELILNDVLPGLHRGEGTALLLDINNLYKRAQENNFSIDYDRLRSIFANRCDLRFCAAFSAVDRRDQDAVNWVSYMEFKGYAMYTKDLQRYINSRGEPVVKGNMDIDICIEALKLSDGFAHIILGTCDGDFVPLVEKLQEGNFRKVSILGMRNHNHAGMSEALVKSADFFYDMMDFKDVISYHGNKGD